MAKYVINKKVISVHLANKVYTKADEEVFDTEGKKWINYKKEIEKAFEEGWLELVEETKQPEKKQEVEKPKQVIKEVQTSKKKED